MSRQICFVFKRIFITTSKNYFHMSGHLYYRSRAQIFCENPRFALSVFNQFDSDLFSLKEHFKLELN